MSESITSAGNNEAFTPPVSSTLHGWKRYWHEHTRILGKWAGHICMHSCRLAFFACALAFLSAVGSLLFVIAILFGTIGLVIRRNRWAWQTFGAASSLFIFAGLMLASRRRETRKPAFQGASSHLIPQDISMHFTAQPASPPV